KKTRYSTAHLSAYRFEPNSNGLVLKNRLGITISDKIDQSEKEEQLRATDELTDIFNISHRFTAADICSSLPPTPSPLLLISSSG
ncbi:MAG: hypothetical protein P8Z71_13655, partial [Candidatus Sulfobium sp.]